MEEKLILVDALQVAFGNDIYLGIFILVIPDSKVQARITKFGPKVHSTFVKVLIVLWSDRRWP